MEGLKDIDFSYLCQALLEQPERIQILDKLAERRYIAGISGISRKTLRHWGKVGLIPYDQEPEKGGKLSAYELIWLECIQLMRQIDESLPKIKAIKENLFVPAFTDMRALIRFGYSYLPETQEKNSIIEKFDSMTDEELAPLYSELEQSLSFFSLLVLCAIVYRSPFQMIQESAVNINLMSRSEFDSFSTKGNQIFDLLSGSSTLFVALSNAITNVVFSGRLDFEDALYMKMLNPREVALIEAIRSGNHKEIKICCDLGGIDALVLTTVHQNSSIGHISKALRLGAKNMDIASKKRDGRIIEVVQTEKIDYSKEDA